MASLVLCLHLDIWDVKDVLTHVVMCSKVVNFWSRQHMDNQQHKGPMENMISDKWR